MPSPNPAATITPLEPLKPDLYERAWCSVPHPTLPLLATAHGKSVTVFSLASRTPHSTIPKGHERSIRSVAWQPALPPGELCLATGSFDASGALWRWGDEDQDRGGSEDDEPAAHSDLETDVAGKFGGEGEGEGDKKDWHAALILDGPDAEMKSIAFSPSGQYVAISSRDKSVWIWEDVGDEDDPIAWETVAVMSEHEGDVKMVAWCPDVSGRNSRRTFGADVLASASYDDTVRIWREDSDGDWVSVAVLEGHKHTVWGVVWEGRERDRDKFPRLATHSGDGTIRIWKLEEDDSGQADAPATATGVPGGLGGIPNTMRRGIKEDWTCEAVLPKVHDGDVYSITWSSRTGLMASAGSDGVIALYREAAEYSIQDTQGTERTAEELEDLPGSRRWTVLTTVQNSHGPYEINHITWCMRYDSVPEKKGVEEMLVTTGDDGRIRTWEVSVAS